MEYESPQKFEYMLLDRMKQDCLYATGWGVGSHYLAGDKAKVHIEEMIKIYNSLIIKPKWLRLKDIKRFYNKIKRAQHYFHNGDEEAILRYRH